MCAADALSPNLFLSITIDNRKPTVIIYETQPANSRHKHFKAQSPLALSAHTERVTDVAGFLFVN